MLCLQASGLENTLEHPRSGFCRRETFTLRNGILKSIAWHQPNSYFTYTCLVLFFSLPWLNPKLDIFILMYVYNHWEFYKAYPKFELFSSYLFHIIPKWTLCHDKTLSQFIDFHQI